MNVAKKVYIVKCVTVLGLIAILSLQMIWLYNMYVLLWNDIKEKAEEQLWTSIELDAIYRIESMPNADEPREILSGPIEEVGDIKKQIIPLQEALIQLGYPIEISQLDSIYLSKLKLENISTEVLLNHIHINNKSIIQSVGASEVSSFGPIKTEIIPIRQDGSEGIQAILLNPYLTIFERMGLILIATILIMAFVAACIVYQIKVILFQNKIAKLREDFSYAMIHDMKTPLSSIQLGIRLLYSNKLTEEKREKSFRIAEEEVAHLLALANKVLTLSKMESGKLKLDKKEFRIAPVIDDQKKIFEKFERAAAIGRNRKGGAAGFGLGLNYVYRVAEAHGGEVRVFSIEDQSSEFTIYLPQLIQTIETL